MICFTRGICALGTNQNIYHAGKNFSCPRNILPADSHPNNKRLALVLRVGWMLSGPVNNSCISVNNPMLLSHVMKILSEFIDTNNILKDGLSKVWFHLKERNTNSENYCFEF